MPQPAVRTESHRFAQRAHEVRSDPLRDDDPRHDEAHQRDGHGGKRAAEEQPHGGAEREGEQRVARRDEAVHAEGGRAEPVRGHLVDGAEPPRDHEAEQPADDRAGQADEPEFDQEPAHRLTLCVQARRNVPVSSSRATSGAPQNMPMSTGTMSTSAAASTCSLPSRCWTGLMQPRGRRTAGPALRHCSCRRRDEMGPGDEEEDAEDDSPAPPMNACVRNWRHEKAITRAPPASGAPGATGWRGPCRPARCPRG